MSLRRAKSNNNATRQSTRKQHRNLSSLSVSKLKSIHGSYLIELLKSEPIEIDNDLALEFIETYKTTINSAPESINFAKQQKQVESQKNLQQNEYLMNVIIDLLDILKYTIIEAYDKVISKMTDDVKSKYEKIEFGNATNIANLFRKHVDKLFDGVETDAITKEQFLEKITNTIDNDYEYTPIVDNLIVYNPYFVLSEPIQFNKALKYIIMNYLNLKTPIISVPVNLPPAAATLSDNALPPRQTSLSQLQPQIKEEQDQKLNYYNVATHINYKTIYEQTKDKPHADKHVISYIKKQLELASKGHKKNYHRRFLLQMHGSLIDTSFFELPTNIKITFMGVQGRVTYMYHAIHKYLDPKYRNQSQLEGELFGKYNAYNAPIANTTTYFGGQTVTDHNLSFYCHKDENISKSIKLNKVCEQNSITHDHKYKYGDMEYILKDLDNMPNEVSNGASNDLLLTLDELGVDVKTNIAKDWGLRLSNLINIINTKFGSNEKGTQNIHIYITSCRSGINDINFAPFINESITKNINKFMCAKNLAKIGYLEKYMTAVQPTELIKLNCSKYEDVIYTNFDESAAYKIGLLSVKDTALTTIHPDLIASKLLNEFINTYVILPYKYIITPEAYSIIHVSPIRFTYILYQLLIRHYHNNNTEITNLVKLKPDEVIRLFNILVTTFRNISSESKVTNINEFLLNHNSELDDNAPFYSVFNNLLHSDKTKINPAIKKDIFKISRAVQILSDIVLALYVNYIPILNICDGFGLNFHSGKLKFIKELKQILPPSHAYDFEPKLNEIFSKIKCTLQANTSSEPVPSANKPIIIQHIPTPSPAELLLKTHKNALNISKSLKAPLDVAGASKGASAKASSKGASKGASSVRPKNSSDLLIYQNCWTVANNLFYLTIPGTGLVSYNHINMNETPDYYDIPLLEKKIFLGDTSVSAEYSKLMQRYYATEFPLKTLNKKDFKTIPKVREYVYKGNGNPYISVPIRTLYVLP